MTVIKNKLSIPTNKKKNTVGVVKPKAVSKAIKATDKKKRKKKGGRFHTGIHSSPKCKKPIHYRSGWELTVCEYLDQDPNVIEYFYEDLIIPYKTKPTQLKNKKYIIDFVVLYKDGSRKIIEVKADHKVNHYITLKKTAAAKEWCSKNNVEYEIWTSIKIQEILKEQKQKDLEKIKLAAQVSTPLSK